MYSVFISWDGNDHDSEHILVMGYQNHGLFRGTKLKSSHFFDISDKLVEKIESIAQGAYTYQLAVAPRTGMGLKKNKGNHFYIKGVMVWFESVDDAMVFKLSYGG